MLWRRWLKWLIVVVDTKRARFCWRARGVLGSLLVMAQRCSTPADPEAARKVAPLGVVLADAEFDSEHNHRHVDERLGAVSVIPAKRGKATWQLQG